MFNITYHHRPQSMRPPNECSTNYQIAKNITSNNFSSISQQPSLCPTLFPLNLCSTSMFALLGFACFSKLFTMIEQIGFGVINQRQLPINQQQATLLPHYQNTPYRPFTPLGYIAYHSSWFFCLTMLTCLF